MAETHGLADEHLSSLHAFPRPEDLSAGAPNALRTVGVSSRKSVTIVNLAQRIQAGDLDLERIADMTDEEAEQFLQQISGVGLWTARYVLLRGLGRLNIFPTGDVGARNKLRRWFAQGFAR
jgi:DNA-3-methyladenine glycosylase II